MNASRIGSAASVVVVIGVVGLIVRRRLRRRYVETVSPGSTPVELALVNVALYFQRKFDWSGATTGQLTPSVSEPTPEDD